MGMTPQQQVRVARLDAPVSHDTLLRPTSASMSREKRVVAALVHLWVPVRGVRTQVVATTPPCRGGCG